MKRTTITFLAALGFAASAVATAQASDLDERYEQSAKDTPHHGYQMYFGPGWMIRARILGVLPDEDTSSWAGAPATSDLSIDNSIVPELDFTYFFTNRFAVEVIAGVTPHDIEGAGALDGTDIGDAWLLPPTVLAQYHFDFGRRIKPYLGAGLNYTVFFNEDPGDVASLELENSFGWALQAGVDFHLGGHWFLNADVKKLWLDTEASVNDGAITADVEIDPWIVGVGVGYRFGGNLEPLK